MTNYVDVKADHDKRQYYVVERATGKVVAKYNYSSELSRGEAAGRANLRRLEINRNASTLRS